MTLSKLIKSTATTRPKMLNVDLILGNFSQTEQLLQNLFLMIQI